MQDISVDPGQFLSFDIQRHVFIRGTTEIKPGVAHLVSNATVSEIDKQRWTNLGGADDRGDGKIDHEILVYKIVTQPLDRVDEQEMAKMLDDGNISKRDAITRLRETNKSLTSDKDVVTIIYFEPQ